MMKGDPTHKQKEEMREEKDMEHKSQKMKSPFGFMILDAPTTFGTKLKMKIIPQSILPNFYGMPTMLEN